jgi:predicted enzyme related to lactoylglutathione lyase
MAAPFESLDFVYTAAPDFAAALRFYTQTLGGELRWRIHDGGVWVAAVRLAGDGPLTLLASHLDAGHSVLIYRVRNLEETRSSLARDGWTDVDEPFQIPQGPCTVFRDPHGQRIAVYERMRPGVERSFEGRMDT